MSDITERLLDRLHSLTYAERKEAADIIEGMQKEAILGCYKIAQLELEIERQAKEIEMLRESSHGHSSKAMSDVVERLRAELRDLKALRQHNLEGMYREADRLDAKIKRQDAEIERQAKEIEMLRESNHGHWAEIERLQKELRLTQSDLQQACNLLGQERGKPLMVAMELFDKSRKDRIR